jgi:hypothetical protein
MGQQSSFGSRELTAQAFEIEHRSSSSIIPRLLKFPEFYYHLLLAIRCNRKRNDDRSRCRMAVVARLLTRLICWRQGILTSIYEYGGPKTAPNIVSLYLTFTPRSSFRCSERRRMICLLSHTGRKSGSRNGKKDATAVLIMRWFWTPM